MTNNISKYSRAYYNYDMRRNFTEAERQVLITLIELDEPIETPNNSHYHFYPKSIEEAVVYFRGWKEDWSQAYSSLSKQGLLIHSADGYILTDTGRQFARQERMDHPPIWYWYREFFTAASHSRAYSHFCERLYGRDLCQAGFSDLAQFDFLISKSGLAPGKRALDLGCGNGGFAEYLHERTGANVTGIDYVPEAIVLAGQRPGALRGCLNFITGNLDHLDMVEGTFDVITSIDTLYMPKNLAVTLKRMAQMLVPGGQMLIFYTEMVFNDGPSRDSLTTSGSSLARALRENDFSYQTWDFSENLFHLMRQKYRLAVEMEDEFAAEGKQFLHNFIFTESDSSSAPYNPDQLTMSRFLYQVSIP